MEEKNNNLGEDMENTSEPENNEIMTETPVEPVEPPSGEQLPKEEEVPSTDISENEGSETSPAEIPPSSQSEPAVYAYRWDYTGQSEHDKKEKKRSEVRGVRNFAIIMTVAFVLAIGTLIGVLFLGDSLSAGIQGTSLSALYDECYPSYVAISITSELGTGGAGSGIIMTDDGFIATNYHVIENAKDINVILYDGTTVPAEYIDGDELNDIAIIKIDKKGLKPATIGNSSAVSVGDQVMAIGTPYSIQYRGTMTSGYISALNRKYAAKNDNGTVNKVITLLQTDTSVNPGNSGGPLFNMDGEVIGIVSMKIAGSEYEGMGFAIPIDGVIDMLNDIIKNGELTISNGGSAFEGAALGISGFAVAKDTKYLLTDEYHYIVTTDDDGNEIVNYITSLDLVLPLPLEDTALLEQYDITDYTLYTAPASGVLVLNITEGFDSAKKLKINDIIVSANGITCEYMESLQEIIANSRVGDKIEFEVFRDGTSVSVTVELGRSAAMGE